MPAYYAEKTLEATFRELPSVYDEIILCDDASQDKTFEISNKLGITTIRHINNKGYGGNQKTLYDAALSRGADIIVMVHPDNQYNTASIPRMIEIIERGEADMVLGSRIASALKNGMPLWKYLGNRFLTASANVIFKKRFSELHSGLRTYSAKTLKQMPYHKFSDDFVFDAEVIAWLIANGHTIREIPVDCYYNEDVSSINFWRSVRYGLGNLAVLYKFLRGQFTKH